MELKISHFHFASFEKDLFDPRRIDKIIHRGNTKEKYSGDYAEYHSPDRTNFSKKKGFFAFTNIGAGHANFAIRLARETAMKGDQDCITGEIGEILWEYAETNEEKNAIIQLDRIHRQIITESRIGKFLSSEIGLEIATLISKSHLLVKNPFPGVPDYKSVEKYEKTLGKAFARFVKVNNIEYMVTSHPSAATIAAFSKLLGPEDGIDSNFMIINCVFDPIVPGDILTSELYDTRSQIHENRYRILTSSSSTARTMFHLGYETKQIVWMSEEDMPKTGGLSEVKRRIVENKNDNFERIAKEGLSPEHPLEIAFISDNLSTTHHLDIIKESVEQISPEINKNLVRVSIMATDSEIQGEEGLRQFCLKNGIKQEEILYFHGSSEELEDLYLNSDDKLKGKKIIFINREPSQEEYEKMKTFDHEYFMDIQESMMVGANIVIGRPSEEDRIAAKYNCCCLDTQGFGFQEEKMGKIYQLIYKISLPFSRRFRPKYWAKGNNGIIDFFSQKTLNEFYQISQRAKDSNLPFYFGEGYGLSQVVFEELNKMRELPSLVLKDENGERKHGFRRKIKKLLQIIKEK